MNMMFGKDQCTIQCHVDGLKINCRNKSVVKSVLSKVVTHYKKIVPLTITHGTVHDYLSMRINFSTNENKVIVTMHEYINEILERLHGTF